MCIYIYVYIILYIYIFHVIISKFKDLNESVFYIHSHSIVRLPRPPELSLAGAGHAPRSFKGGLFFGGRDWIDSLLVIA